MTFRDNWVSILLCDLFKLTYLLPIKGSADLGIFYIPFFYYSCYSIGINFNKKLTIKEIDPKAI